MKDMKTFLLGLGLGAGICLFSGFDEEGQEGRYQLEAGKVLIYSQETGREASKEYVFKIDTKTGEVIEFYDAEIERLKTEPVDEALLGDTKSAMRYSFARGLNSPGPLARPLAHYLQLTGDPETVNRVYALYDAVTADDIRAVATTYFGETNRTVVLLREEAQ